MIRAAGSCSPGLPGVSPSYTRAVGPAHLEEADRHEEEAVGADAPREHLVQVPLQEELLQHQDQVRQHRVLLRRSDTSGTLRGALPFPAAGHLPVRVEGEHGTRPRHTAQGHRARLTLGTRAATVRGSVANG